MALADVMQRCEHGIVEEPSGRRVTALRGRGSWILQCRRLQSRRCRQSRRSRCLTRRTERASGPFALRWECATLWGRLGRGAGRLLSLCLSCLHCNVMVRACARRRGIVGASRSASNAHKVLTLAGGASSEPSSGSEGDGTAAALTAHVCGVRAHSSHGR
eukprot:15430943-Alexandrium_andersonii.AAC.1